MRYINVVCVVRLILELAQNHIVLTSAVKWLIENYKKMCNSTIILQIAAVVISGYIINTAGRHKALKSISLSDYWLKKPWRWIFEATMFICGGAIFYCGRYGFEDSIYTIMIGGILICGVGVFSRFLKNNFQRTMHYLCAFGGFALLGLAPFISFGLWWVSLAILVCVLLVYLFSVNKGVRVWNTEVVLIYLILMTLTCLICIYGKGGW